MDGCSDPVTQKQRQARIKISHVAPYHLISSATNVRYYHRPLSCITIGTYVSKEARAEKKRSMAIDKQIEEDRRRRKNQRKILLLGSKNSGKSTIIKQMKFTHQLQNGHAADELAVFRLMIYENLIDSAKSIVLAMKKIGVDCVEDINRTYATEILAYRVESHPSFRLSAHITSAIYSLMQDPIIATLMVQSSDFLSTETAAYFFSQVERIGQTDYVPSETDVLHARVKAKGISETQFTVDQKSIHIIDVGDLSSEQGKWVHFFGAITCIIFCVSLSEYDEILPDKNGRTKLAESLALFDSLIDSPPFSETPVILLLNKLDIFTAKLPRVPLEQYLPNYGGGSNIDEAVDCIRSIFWRKAGRWSVRGMYSLQTQATNSLNLRMIFTFVEDIVLQSKLRARSLL